MHSQTTIKAAPTQSTAEQARAKALALLARLEAAEAAQAVKRRGSYYLAPALTETEKQHEPSTDPARWQGFI